MVDDFIDSVTTFACSLAKHRNSTTLEVRDLMTHLGMLLVKLLLKMGLITFAERNWNIKIPGYGNVDNARPFKRAIGSEGHKTRLALVRKNMVPPAKQQKLQ